MINKSQADSTLTKRSSHGGPRNKKSSQNLKTDKDILNSISKKRAKHKKTQEIQI